MIIKMVYIEFAIKFEIENNKIKYKHNDFKFRLS